MLLKNPPEGGAGDETWQRGRRIILIVEESRFYIAVALSQEASPG